MVLVASPLVSTPSSVCATLGGASRCRRSRRKSRCASVEPRVLVSHQLGRDDNVRMHRKERHLSLDFLHQTRCSSWDCRNLKPGIFALSMTVLFPGCRYAAFTMCRPSA